MIQRGPQKVDENKEISVLKIEVWKRKEKQSSK